MGVVSRRWMWVESIGVATGCGCKEVYRFPHITYPYSSCICSFLQQHPYFLFIFFVLVRYSSDSEYLICLKHVNVFLLNRFVMKLLYYRIKPLSMQ